MISGCTLHGRRFAGVGIGSETSECGVRNVQMENCKIDCLTLGIYIKTRIGRAGVIENISGDDLDVLSGGFLKVNPCQRGKSLITP